MTCPECYQIKLENDRLKQTITLNSWKGKDHIQIKRISPDYWTVIEHSKIKNTSKIRTTTHRIKNENVCNMIKYIKELTYDKIQKSTNKSELVLHIIDALNLSVSEDSFNGGGKNRSLYYFPIYYFPIKILEHLEFVEFTRVKTTPLQKFYAYNNELNKLKQYTLF